MRLLFVCTANMCRSPLAEVLCVRALETRGLSGIEVASAGVFATRDRPAAPAAVRVASSLGLDLTEHRSRPFDRASVGADDLVLVMEEGHRRQILAEFKLDPAMIRLLGPYAPGGPTEIDDPIGGPDVAYLLCVERLERCLGGLLDWLEEHALSRG